jgi:hypothetical protein
VRNYRNLAGFLLMASAAVAVPAQEKPTAKTDVATATAPSGSGSPVTINASSTPIELARAAVAAQGGDKFKNLKSMLLIGTADLYAPSSTQSIPGKFAMVTAGDRVRLDIDARPIMSFKQIYDGQQSYTSIPGVEMPPASKFGLSELMKYDQPGYTVTALPDNKKKQRAFRIADAEGNATDYYIDPATGRVMSFLILYKGYTVGTEHTKFKEVDGVLIPMSFTQRLEMPAGAFFAEFKVKDVKLNQPLANDVFVIQ